MKLLKEVTQLFEGTFRNEFDNISEIQANKLASSLNLSWQKLGAVWTMHDGESHLLTYSKSKKTLFTDKSWDEISLLLGE